MSTMLSITSGIPFRLPPPPGSSLIPEWTGRGFRVGERCVKVLEYSSAESGWSDELTDFHESHAGSDHFIDSASRKRVSLTLAAHGAKTGTVLDVGCSSGLMIRELRHQFPRLTVMGSDVVRLPLERLSATIPDVPLLRFDLVRCPLPDDAIDFVLLLNVLEHIEDDREALRQVFRILKPGGFAVLEVPAGPNLYDVYDEFLMHYRRYRLAALAELVSGIGFEIVEKSHLGFLIFPSFFLAKKTSRLLSRYRKADPGRSVSVKIRSTRRNSIARGLMNLELMLGRRVSFPFGVRCVLTLRKPLGSQ